MAAEFCKCFLLQFYPQSISREQCVGLFCAHACLPSRHQLRIRNSAYWDSLCVLLYKCSMGYGALNGGSGCKVPNP
jgi:hypothetical protein